MPVVKRPMTKYTVATANEAWCGTFMIDDAGGHIHVTSEWGEYTYWWGPGGRGTKTLREFLVSADASYLKDKFMYQYVQLGISRAAQTKIAGRLDRMLSDVWPLFIDYIKDELSTEVP